MKMEFDTHSTIHPTAFSEQESSEKMHSESLSGCALCGQKIILRNIVDNHNHFCCHGCQAVFNILSTQNQLQGFAQHPLFLQALHSGLISNPTLLDHIRKQRAETAELPREKIYFEIADMWCPSCAELIRLMLLKEKGVVNCVVDYATDLASIEFTPQFISKQSLTDCICQLGYKPATLESGEGKKATKELQWRFGIAAFCALNIMMFAYPLYATYFDYDGEGYGNLFAWLSGITSLPILFYSAWPIWRRFTVSLKTGFFGMETLVAISVGSATTLSFWELYSGGNQVYFDSLSVIILFVLLGKLIEGRAKFSAKEALMRLTRATPRRARKRLADGRLHFVPLKEVAKGDCLVAYAGEKLALDGVVCEGEGASDESLMTGEAIPIVKKKGASLLGGAILIHGWVAYTVTHTLEESVLSKIIEMIGKDIGDKTVYVRAADQIVRWFVPVVILMATLTAAFCLLFPGASEKAPYQAALLRALSVLLISCPCAIGIAAPAAESYLLNRLAALGVIVRNRAALRFLGKETLFIFDKTGTVTQGCYTVLAGVKTLTQSEREVLGTMASRSTHPISVALSMLFQAERKVQLEMFEEIAGMGLNAVFEGTRYALGSVKIFSGEQVCDVFDPEVYGGGIISKVYFVKEECLISEIYLGDCVRPEVQPLITSLKPLRTLLLSGDSETAVAVVARKCGFDQWQARVTPLEKRELVENLRRKGEIVCMIGDGINDAPALTIAQVGISVVNASDLSIQVSDLLLTTERLNVIQKMRKIAFKGQKIIVQNLFWAFFYNLIGIGLAMLGLLTPVFSAIAMSLSSLFVLFNARRLSE